VLKSCLCVTIAFFCCGIAEAKLPEHHHHNKGKHVTSTVSRSETQMSGIASWYGNWHAGRKTANGESFNPNCMTAAHKTLPMNSIVKVTDTTTGKSVIVRVNDRGPYRLRRVIDLSREAAEVIGMKGLAKVRLNVLRYGRMVPAYGA